MTPLEKHLPIPGETFTVQDHPAFLIRPPEPVGAMPWVWYAPTLPGLPAEAERWMFEKFLGAGIAIAGIDVGESYGSPRGRALYSALHEHLVCAHNMAKKACLLARSRGGLMLYNWAIDHPMSVACIAGIYPVCNLVSYPGLAKASVAYETTESQLDAARAVHNPIDRLDALAKAGVPIFHIHGDDDQVVPLDANSAELAKRYRLLGGPMTLRIFEGQGHSMWHGWFQCQELVDFLIDRAHSSVV